MTLHVRPHPVISGQYILPNRCGWIVSVSAIPFIIYHLLWAVFIGNSCGFGKQDVTHLTMNGISEKVQIHMVRNNHLPASLEEVFGDSGVPRDGWGHFFHFEPLPKAQSLALGYPRGFRITSLGADGEIGGQGEDADLAFVHGYTGFIPMRD